jgi:hypothetical protein
MAAEFHPVAPVDPTNLRPMLFLDEAREMMLGNDWSPVHCRADAPDALIEKFCRALVTKRDSIVRDIGGATQPPLPLDRMARESPYTPQDVPLHPAAAAVWREHGFL